MRLGLVAAIWILFVGGLASYMRYRDVAGPGSEPAVELKLAEGRYRIEVTPGFTPVPDPFALRTGQEPSAPALVVRLAGRELLRLSGGVEAGRPVWIEDVRGLVAGSNEIYVQVSPPIEQGDRRHFVLVRVLRDGVPIAEQTFWGEGGLQVAGTCRFEVEPRDGGDADAH